jgi:hypothetical protein
MGDQGKGIVKPPLRVPTTGAFIILLIVIWALNLADTFQTLYLKQSGFLAEEANWFIDFFLKEGRAQFFLAKVLALILITSILVRGWIDKKGIRIFSIQYSQNQARAAIYFLLAAGAIYYIFIVGFPFVALLISGLFAD